MYIQYKKNKNKKNSAKAPLIRLQVQVLKAE